MDHHSDHQMTADTNQHQTHSADHHGGHGVDHTNHEIMFRNRFWVSLGLSMPVLLYSPALQAWLNFSMPTFPGSQWVTPLFAIIIFLYGGIPFRQMAIPKV